MGKKGIWHANIQSNRSMKGKSTISVWRGNSFSLVFCYVRKVCVFHLAADVYICWFYTHTHTHRQTVIPTIDWWKSLRKLRKPAMSSVNHKRSMVAAVSVSELVRCSSWDICDALLWFTDTIEKTKQKKQPPGALTLISARSPRFTRWFATVALWKHICRLGLDFNTNRDASNGGFKEIAFMMHWVCQKSSAIINYSSVMCGSPWTVYWDA